MNAIKSYILAPNFDIPAEGPGAIRLGHIIFDPTSPNVALNRTNVLSPPESIPIIRMTKPSWTGTISQARAKRFGIWARFLELVGLGGELSVDSSHDRENQFTFDSLETIYMEPDLEYVRGAMECADVKRFLEAGRYKKPVYMVTGLKIARGAMAIGSESDGRGAKGSLGFDGAAYGLPAAVGPEFEVSSSKKNAASFDGAESFAFAIRLRTIKYKKGGELQQSEYRHGTVLGVESGEDEEEENPLYIGRLEDQDTTEFAEAEVMRGFEDDEGENTQYVVLSRSSGS